MNYNQLTRLRESELSNIKPPSYCYLPFFSGWYLHGMSEWLYIKTRYLYSMIYSILTYWHYQLLSIRCWNFKLIPFASICLNTTIIIFSYNCSYFNSADVILSINHIVLKASWFILTECLQYLILSTGAGYILTLRNMHLHRTYICQI